MKRGQSDQNHKGDVVLAAALNIERCRGMVEAQVRPCIIGPWLLRDVLVACVVLLSNNAYVVNIFNGNTRFLWHFWHIYEVIKHLRTGFPDFILDGVVCMRREQ